MLINKTDVKSVICVPLLHKNDLQGILYLDNRIIGELFNNEQLEIISLLSEQAGISISNSSLYTMATIDYLTKVYNRGFISSYLTKQIHSVRRYKGDLSIIMIDIDHFKQINDTYGHQTGDLVLVEVAQRITNTIRISDVTGRYGGEEFVIILPETNCANGSIVAERIRNAIAESVMVLPANDDRDGTLEVPVTISLGITEFEKGDNLFSIIKRADEGLYRVKNSGRNRIGSK